MRRRNPQDSPHRRELPHRQSRTRTMRLVGSWRAKEPGIPDAIQNTLVTLG